MLQCFLRTHSSKFFIFALAILIILGSYLRIYGIKDYGLGLDDIRHIDLSLGSPWNIIINSYFDAHPPLRNLILNVILRSSDSIYLSRLIALLPGVILIPAFYFFIVNIYSSRIAGLTGATIITFSNLFISTSQGTRPYMLAAIILILYLYYWISIIRSERNRDFLMFLISGFLLFFTDYGVIGIVLSISLIGFCQLLYRGRIKSAMIWASICIAQLGLFLIQIYLVYQKSHYRPESSAYIRDYLSLNMESLIKTTGRVFQVNLSNSYDTPFVILFLFVSGIIFSFWKKEWRTLALALIPLTTYVLMAQFELYPLYPGRHTALFSIILLIIICYSIKRFVEFDLILLKLISLILMIALFFNLESPRISFVNPEKFNIKNSDFFEVGLTSQSFSMISDLINAKNPPIDLIITSTFMEDFFQKNQFLAPEFFQLYQEIPKFYCQIDLFQLSTKKGVKICIDQLANSEGSSAIGKRYAYLMSSFFPTFWEMPLESISFSRIDVSKNLFVFSFKFVDGSG